jgi:DNA (cytosine-5)-methyltransferase 1
MKEKYCAIDLFAGCGGLTQGLKKAGFDVLAGVELNQLASNTYEKNHPEVKLLNQDIRKIDVKKLRSELGLKKGDLDLLAGCPPCQGFSTLRTNKKTVAVNDNRNNLMFEFLKFIDEFAPKTLMMENVPGLQKGKRIKTFVDELQKRGYFVNFDVLNVADFGVPQNRKRFILMASIKETVGFAPALKNKVFVKDVLEGLEIPEESSDPAHNHGESRSEKVKEIISLIPKNGGSRASLPKHLWLECHKGKSHFLDVYGRLKWDGLSSTITGGCVNPSKGRFLHPLEDRTITIREAALLQSFPKNYYISMENGKSHAALMVGNALPPEFIRRQAEHIKKHLER